MVPYDPTQPPRTDDPRVLRRLPLPTGDTAQGAPAPQAAPPTLPRVQVPSQARTSPAAQQTATIPLPQTGQPQQSALQQENERLARTGPGVRQIHNPILRTLATVGDVASSFFPGASMMIPGTTLHHALLTRENERALGQERAGQKEASENALQQAEIPLKQAETEEAQARAESLRNPVEKGGTVHEDSEGNMWVVRPDGTATAVAPQGGGQLKGKTPAEKSGTVHEDSEGNMWLIKGDGTASPITAQGAQLKGKAPAGKEGELPLGTFADQVNAANEARYQVLNPGKPLPPQYRLTDKSTQKQADEISKLLGGTEAASGVKAQHEQAAATAAANRQQRTDSETRKAAYKAYEPALDSAERFNVMAKNYEEAVKNHDQQAMLSLLANHLGMTMGLQKGSRLTRDIIREAQQSRPWLQGMQAKFDNNGYLSGVTLTPQQMRQMVDLGQERFREDLTKGRSEAQYMGAADEGPARIPNKSTINFYVGLANGDANRAKQLAAEDGWTVK